MGEGEESEVSGDAEQPSSQSVNASSDRDDNNVGVESAAGTDRPSNVASSNLHSIPLVELTLENITYAPLTRSAGGGSPPAAGGIGGLLKRRQTQPPKSGSTAEVKSRKVILHDVSAQIKPYTLSAWMGPSGSGKSSLVAVAAGYCQPSDLINSSAIGANGSRGAPPKRLISVVYQDDLLLPNLTVQETIAFAARLKNPEDVGKEAVARLVHDTIEELGLDGVKDSLVGGVTKRGISGGERKRLAVAVELVGKPSVILLDEPTSGLDSTSAFQLISTLKELARVGHSIAVVVHQPRTEIFDLFDDLLLLSRGRTVYSGQPNGVQQYLEQIPTVQKLPLQTGIADWLMDVISHDEKREGGGILAHHWKEESKLNTLEAGDDNTLQRRLQLKKRLSSLVELYSEPKFKTSFWTQLKLLTRRSVVQQRGERLTHVACIFTTAYILFTGVLYWRLPDNTERIYERMSLLFFTIITQANAIVTSSMTLFSRERNLLKRERAKKMYACLPYFLAKTLSDMTNTILLPSVYGIIVYWMAGLRPTASSFFTFVLIFYLTVSTSQSVGLLLSVTIPSLQVALMLAPALMIFLFILAGFYVPLNNLNPAIAWASWASFCRYGYSALLINEFSGRNIECAEDDSLSTSPGGGITQCPLPGDEVLTNMGLQGVFLNVWVNVGILVLIQALTRVATYFLLRRQR